MTKVTQLDFTGTTIFCGLDIYELSWRVIIGDTEQEVKVLFRQFMRKQA